MSENQVQTILSTLKALEDKFDKRFDSFDRRFDSIESRLDHIEADLDKIEAWTGYRADPNLPKAKNGKKVTSV